MSQQHFDATNELAKLNDYCQSRRKSHYPRSRLQKCRAELVALSKAGASLRQLALWLKKNKRIKISHMREEPEEVASEQSKAAELVTIT